MEGYEPGPGPSLPLVVKLVLEQTGCEADNALPLLNARAQLEDRTLAQIANAVLDGSIRFDE